MKHLTQQQVNAFIVQTRATTPLVQCITNDVVTAFTANVLIASGMSPAMVADPHESGDFAQLADALLINIGTLTQGHKAGMVAAIQGALSKGIPWVLDPVAVSPKLPWRYEFALALLALGPTVVRANPAEVMALAYGTEHGRGVDSLMVSQAALKGAEYAARSHNTICVVTGAVDYITDGVETFMVPFNVPSLTTITGTGCALSALVAGFLGAAPKDAHRQAAAAACTMMSIAGHYAQIKAKGPGSLAVYLLDELALLTSNKIVEVYENVQ